MKSSIAAILLKKRKSSGSYAAELESEDLCVPCAVQHIMANRTKIESWIYTGVLGTILKLKDRIECHSDLADSLKMQ